MSIALAPKPTAPTNEELFALIQSLKAENDALKARAATSRPIGFKVTEKGGVAMYGLGRFPVTLYASQWDALLAHVDALRAFLTAHRSELATKDQA